VLLCTLHALGARKPWYHTFGINAFGGTSPTWVDYCDDKATYRKRLIYADNLKTTLSLVVVESFGDSATGRSLKRIHARMQARTLMLLDYDHTLDIQFLSTRSRRCIPNPHIDEASLRRLPKHSSNNTTVELCSASHRNDHVHQSETQHGTALGFAMRT
jgi:hypothetical protein